eukprot:scaffold37762_cov239-Skeletonema_marinoi.AAC.2
MGRSQVERNRIKGRPGRGGRGRGGGSGAGGRGGGGGRSSSNKRRSGPDPRTLGDNAFRFERRNKDDTSNDDDYGSSDMLLDDFNTGLLLGSDYYGASHYDLQEDDYNEVETTTSFENSSDNDWMSVDVQALTACLKQLPIHERLDVPYHVGKHIESRYGIDNAAAGRQKTLAELREESKCIVNNDDDYGISNSADDLPTVEEVDTNTNQNSLETEEAKADNSDGDEDDEDDLDAWLDDMIS